MLLARVILVGAIVAVPSAKVKVGLGSASAHYLYVGLIGQLSHDTPLVAGELTGTLWALRHIPRMPRLDPSTSRAAMPSKQARENHIGGKAYLVGADQRI